MRGRRAKGRDDAVGADVFGIFGFLALGFALALAGAFTVVAAFAVVSPSVVREIRTSNCGGASTTTSRGSARAARCSGATKDN